MASAASENCPEPGQTRTITDHLIEAGNFKIFLSFVAKGDQSTFLAQRMAVLPASNGRPQKVVPVRMTAFVPTDEAFAGADATVEKILKSYEASNRFVRGLLANRSYSSAELMSMFGETDKISLKSRRGTEIDLTTHRGSLRLGGISLPTCVSVANGHIIALPSLPEVLLADIM